MFDSSVILPASTIIKSAGSHLYRIGLSHYQFGDKKRTKLSNPWFIFIIMFILWIRFMLTLVLRTENKNISIMIGDFAYFLKIRH